jgi:NDP-sugar pyrophosphorylase family protein
LRSVVADRPKVLADVGGRPFVTYLLDQLAVVGIRRVVFCTGHLGAQIREMFGDAYGDLHVDYSHESIPLGTGGALRLALPLFDSDPVLVMNGDSYCHADLKAFLDWHTARGAQASLLLIEAPDTHRYGQVWTDEDGRVRRFAEKGDVGGPGWISAGVYAMSHCVIEAIPYEGASSLEHDVFPVWIGRGLYGYRSEGSFLDIGIPEAYAAAPSFFAPQWQ